MRIALISTSYPAHAGDPAGHFVRAEALDLCARGHEVHVIVPANAGSASGAPRAPSPTVDGRRSRWTVHDSEADRSGSGSGSPVVWPVPHAGLFGWPGAAARFRQRPWRGGGAVPFGAFAVRRLRQLRPDAVIAHWIVPCGYPIGVAAGGRGGCEAWEVVAHGADVRLLLASPRSFRCHVIGTLLDFGARFRVVAESTAHELACALPAALRRRFLDRVQVRPALLDVPDVRAAAAALRSRGGHPVLAVAVGRLLALKRVDLAIRAVNLLGPGTHLCVVGDGPERERLTRLDRTGNVTFEGTLGREQALAWIAASDVLVHPSATEAAPTVVREARILGTPVVACDAGDVARWACHDEGIRIVPPVPDAIAEAILGAEGWSAP